jgi:phosphoserine phosphatase
VTDHAIGGQTILIQVSGPDRPGVTAQLMTLLTEAGAELDDVEQVVIRRHLTLGLVVRLPEGANLSPIHDLGEANGLSIQIAPADSTPTERELGTVVTLLAPQISPANLGAIAGVVASHGGNIDRIVRLSSYPVTSYELTVLGADIDDLRPTLVAASHSEGIDVALQPDGLGRRSQRLVVLDVDSTLIQNEVIDLLADERGCGPAVAALTARAMEGELDFETALRERVRLLAGLDMAGLERARERVALTPGARTFVRTLKRMGFRVAIVSGGFTFVTDELAARLGVDHSTANVLEIVDGRLTGELTGRVVDRGRKAEVLAEVAAIEGIPLDQTVAIGDGANDLDMLALAGLGIAFNAKPVVRDQADASVNVPYLDAILFVLGVRRSEVEDADERDGLLPDEIRAPV